MPLPGPRVSMIFKRNTGSTSDGMGNILPVWTTLFTVTGVVGTLRGNERIIAGMDTEIADLKFFVDYVAATTGTLTERDEVTVGSTTYTILYIRNPALQNEHLEILVQRVAQ